MLSVRRYVLATLVGPARCWCRLRHVPIRSTPTSTATAYAIGLRSAPGPRSSRSGCRTAGPAAAGSGRSDSPVRRRGRGPRWRSRRGRHTGRSGLQIWINRGSGRFAPLPVPRHAPRRARHFLDDHTQAGDLGNIWSDATRTFIAAVTPRGAPLAPLLFAPTAVTIRFRRNPDYPRRAPRGPPSPRFS